MEYNIPQIEKTTNNTRENKKNPVKDYFLEGNRVQNQKGITKFILINILLNGQDKSKLILEEIQMTAIKLSYIIINEIVIEI